MGSALIWATDTSSTLDVVSISFSYTSCSQTWQLNNASSQMKFNFFYRFTLSRRSRTGETHRWHKMEPIPSLLAMQSHRWQGLGSAVAATLRAKMSINFLICCCWLPGIIFFRSNSVPFVSRANGVQKSLGKASWRRSSRSPFMLRTLRTVYTSSASNPNTFYHN